MANQLTPEADAKLALVSQLLSAAVDRQTSDGVLVQPGDWGLAANYQPNTIPVYVVDEGCLCPMACVLVNQPAQARRCYSPEEDAAAILGIEPQQVTNFVVGFDHGELNAPDYQEDEYYWLGRAFRARMCG